MMNTHRIRIFQILSWLERTAFRLAKTAALPARVSYALAKPDGLPWSYTQLLEITERFPGEPKPGIQAVLSHQRKWARRVAQAARLFSAKKVLEVGCGQGFLADILVDDGLEVYASDVVDILDARLKEKRLKFCLGDVCSRLPFQDEAFDLAYAINAFEHFPDPGYALDEMLRVLKPGGVIFLTFDPLYYSPWGLHASRRIGFPYPQLLFSKETIQRFLDEKTEEIAHTYSEGSDRSKIGPDLNEYSLAQYRKIFRERRKELKLMSYVERTSLDGLQAIRANPCILKKYSPSFEDLIVGGIKVVGIKREPRV
jgi:SAM-dependent methyltransferase